MLGSTYILETLSLSPQPHFLHAVLSCII